MAKAMTPIRSIREACLDCCGYQRTEVKHCGAIACSLWPYRNNRRPKPAETELHLQAKASLDERNRLMSDRTVS